jgi:hypothetical protein
MRLDTRKPPPYRVRTFLPEQRMRVPPQLATTLSPLASAARPLRERVADRLSDLLFDADHLLHLLEAEAVAADLRWLEPNIRAVYESVSTLMQSFCD